MLLKDLCLPSFSVCVGYWTGLLIGTSVHFLGECNCQLTWVWHCVVSVSQVWEGIWWWEGTLFWGILTSSQDLFTPWVLCTILVLSECCSIRESSDNDGKNDQTVGVPHTEQLSQSSSVWKSSNWWECERGLQGHKWSRQWWVISFLSSAKNILSL